MDKNAQFKQKAKEKLSSFEDASVLRKFTILFLLVSVVPLAVLYYLYIEIQTQGSISLGADQLNLTLTFVVLGILLGFFTLRKILQHLVDLTRRNREAIKDLIGEAEAAQLSQEQNEIIVLSKSFSAITRRLEENVRSLEQTKKTLHAVMSKVGQGISSMENIDTFLELIVETVTQALQASIGILLLHNLDKNELEVKTIFGADTRKKRNTIKIEPGSKVAALLASKKPVIMAKLSSEMAASRGNADLFKAPIICAPLVFQGKSLGMIAVSGRASKENFTQDETSLLFNLATQTAVAVENSRLSSNIESTYFETISALALAVDAKDKYSRGHLDRVAAYCVQIGRKLGLEEADICTLREAARLHDLGKIGIPDEVLQKEGKLTDEEWILMRRHPEIGESIIKPIRSLSHLCDIIRHHHEKLDGTGYPDGLHAIEITPLVRITTVADIYDALTTDRSYRTKFNQDKAVSILRDMKTELDQEIVEAFVETLQNPTEEEFH